MSSTSTGIEWTGATWNPIVGCTIVSPGCTNCYAMQMAARIERMAGGKTHYAGTTKATKAGPVWTGKLAMAPDHIAFQPLRWKKPRRIFVNSMSDLFHESVPDEWIDRVFAVMALAPQHQFQILTKRSRRMLAYMTEASLLPRLEFAMDQATLIQPGNRKWPLPNVWLGVSAEDQVRYDERSRDLRLTPAAVHFFSFEPLLGQIVADYLGEWAIVGGESGPSARPMHPDWALSLRDQCAAAGVPFFFKQWGEWAPRAGTGWHHWIMADGSSHDETFDTRAHLNATLPMDSCGIERVGKKAAGNMLNGQQYLEFPR